MLHMATAPKRLGDLDLAGYREALPGWVDGNWADDLLEAAGDRCDACGREGLALRPFIRPEAGSFRAIYECGGCGHCVEM